MNINYTLMMLIVMRYVQPPHLILRKQLIAGVRISSFASDVANFCARTLFYTSALAMEGEFVKYIHFFVLIYLLTCHAHHRRRDGNYNLNE
jgi:5-methylthioribose kinase